MKALDDVALRTVHCLIEKAKSHALKDLSAWLLLRRPLMGLRWDLWCLDVLMLRDEVRILHQLGSQL